MRLVLAFLVACSGTSKPSPTPSPSPSPSPTPVAEVDAAAPEPAPVAPEKKVSVADLESIAKPAKSAKVTQAEIAWQLNEDGKKLAVATKYADASAKFRDAVARVPQPPYFYNLCFTLYSEGKFSEALTACSAAKNLEPPAALVEKVENLMAHIKFEAHQQGIDVKSP